jgi:hypothetical protein
VSESIKYRFPWPLLPLFVIPPFALGLMVGVTTTSSFYERTAVKRGHAEWVANEHGQAEFKWKEAKP